MTKYFYDAEGNCLGGFDGAEPPANSIEGPVPNHGLDKFINGVLIPYEPDQTVLQRLSNAYADLSVDKRVKYGNLMAEVAAFLNRETPDFQAVEALIINAQIDEEDEPIRQYLLSIMKEGNQ